MTRRGENAKVTQSRSGRTWLWRQVCIPHSLLVCDGHCTELWSCTIYGQITRPSLLYELWTMEVYMGSIVP
ncbi:hypothetical protein OIU76_009421 [Salix suchowensis]|nr:hypothetical protein OIU76_009421 [Salix suchowensis]